MIFLPIQRNNTVVNRGSEAISSEVNMSVWNETFAIPRPQSNNLPVADKRCDMAADGGGGDRLSDHHASQNTGYP